MKLFKYLIGIIAIIFLSGCGELNLSMPSTSSSSMPKWYLNAPSSNAMTYYAVGEGKTKQAAKLDALNQIAGEISTTISSSLNVVKSSLNVNGKSIVASSSVKQNIKSEINKIKFSNAKVIKTAYVDSKFLVLVSVDREELFNVYKTQIDAIKVDIQNIYNLAKVDFISYIKHKKELDDKINQLVTKITLAKTINPNFNAQSYFDWISNIKYNLQKMVSNTKIAVKIDNSNLKSYKQVIEKYLNKLGVRIVKHSNFIIKLSMKANPKHVQVRDPRLIGVKWADVVITIKVIKDNNIISSNVIEVINGSKSSYQSAVRKTKKFERKIEEIGFSNMLIGK
jgi:hypothetical protein